MDPKPESKKGNTRQRILLAAIQLAARHGFAGISFQMIADELGLSQPAVLYHFSSKDALNEELIRTIIRHNHKIVMGLIELTDDAGRRLLKHCLGNVMWALRYRQEDAQVLILLYSLAARNKTFSDLFKQMIAGGRERLAAHLLAGVKEGQFRLKEEPALLAQILQDELFGAMLYAAAAPEGSVNLDELEEKWKTVIAAFTGWAYMGTSSVVPAAQAAMKASALNRTLL